MKSKFIVKNHKLNKLSYAPFSCHMRNALRLCTLHVQGNFWLTYMCPNQAQDGLLEILSSPISKYASISQNYVDLTLQNFNLLRLLYAQRLGKNMGRNMIFWCFFPLWPPESAN